MNDKYQLLKDDTIVIIDGDRRRTLYRIQALKDIENVLLGVSVKAGDLGGYVESERNLAYLSDSEDGEPYAWISGSAMVYGNARIEHWAQVMEQAVVKDNAVIGDFSWVGGNAVVSGDAVIENSSSVQDNATVTDNVRLSGTSDVYGNAIISGDCKLEHSADISGNAKLSGHVCVEWEGIVTDNAVISGNVLIRGKVCGNAVLDGSGKTVVDYDEIIDL